MNWTRVLFIFLMLGVLAFTLLFYRPVLGYLLVSLVFAYILDPVVSWLEFKRVPRWLSVLLVYAVIVGAIAWLSVAYIPRLIEQGNQLIALINQTDKPLDVLILELPFIESLYTFMKILDSSLPQLQLAPKFVNLIVSAQAGLGELPNVLFHNYQSILSTIALFFILPVFSFFLLKDKKQLRRALVSLVPNRYFELALILMKKIDDNVGRYMRAIILEMLSVGVMSSVALSIVGVPYAVLIGLLAGVTNIIPYVGPWIGGAIAAVTLLVTGRPPVMILWMAAAMFLVQALDNYIVYPLVIGKTMKMHPLVVLVTVFAGGYFGGVIWMLVSVPLVYMIFSLVKALHTNLKQFRLI